MSESLQFDRAELVGQKASACAACTQPLMDQYYVVNGHAVCPACRDGLLARLGPGAPVNVAGALAYGAVAALAGALAWYAVIRLTGYNLGIVAVGVGYLVAMAVQKGGGRRGGPLLQAMAVGLTYLAIALVPAPAIIGAVLDGATMNVAWSSVIGRLLLTPFYAGPIGLLINGFALYEAWKLTRGPRLAITGPHALNAATPYRG